MSINIVNHCLKCGLPILDDGIIVPGILNGLCHCNEVSIWPIKKENKMTVDERIASLEKELEELKKERKEEKGKEFFPRFVEWNNGDIVFIESAKSYALSPSDGKGWSMWTVRHKYGRRLETWNIDMSHNFTGTLKIKDGKVVSVKSKKE